VSILASIAMGFIAKVPGMVEAVGNVLIKRGETEAQKQGIENKSGNELALGYLSHIAETNKIKAQSQTERQVIAALVLFALPSGIHWWSVNLDSIPFYIPWFMDQAHIVGSWKVAALPGEYGVTNQEIIRSFFITTGAVAGISVLAKAFRR
jgi:hypothetical protein